MTVDGVSVPPAIAALDYGGTRTFKIEYYGPEITADDIYLDDESATFELVTGEGAGDGRQLTLLTFLDINAADYYYIGVWLGGPDGIPLIHFIVEEEG